MTFLQRSPVDDTAVGLSVEGRESTIEDERGSGKRERGGQQQHELARTKESAKRACTRILAPVPFADVRRRISVEFVQFQYKA